MRRLNNKRHRAIVQAIVDAPVAWVSVEELAGRVGAPLDSLLDSLATLDVEGWISPWEDGERISVTLSAFAAERFRVRIVEYGRAATPRWRPIDEPIPCPRGHCAIGGDADIELFDQMADPAPPPDIAAELAEARRRIIDPDEPPSPKTAALDLPRPMILLGLGAGPFPGPAEAAAKGESCPVCGSTVETSTVEHPRAYCLWCDRWGLDAALGATGRPAAQSRRSRTPNQAAQLRKRRKDRRRTKRGGKWSSTGKPASRTGARTGKGTA